MFIQIDLFAVSGILPAYHCQAFRPLPKSLFFYAEEELPLHFVMLYLGLALNNEKTLRSSDSYEQVDRRAMAKPLDIPPPDQECAARQAT